MNIPAPKVSHEVYFTYVLDEPYIEGHVLVEKVTVTVWSAGVDPDEGPYDAYANAVGGGYPLTEKGKIDKRSTYGPVFPSYEFRRQFEDDAMARYEAGERG